MKFKVGDKVKIKRLEEIESAVFNGDMAKYCGEVVTIRKIVYGQGYFIEEHSWFWNEQMLEDDIIEPRKQQQFQSGIKRNDSTGKPRFDLICPLSQAYDKTLLYRWAMLLTKGMEIYSARNWEQANGHAELESFKASAERHFRQAMAGDTTEDHFAAVLFNLNGIVYLMDKLNCDVKGVGK